MRMFAVGLFVYFGLIAAIATLSTFVDRPLSPQLLSLITLLIFVLLVVCAMAISSRRRRKSIAPRQFQTLEELEAAGLLVSEDYTARRAFQVEEVEDEGPHYFIELADGRVLYLNGQYLYEYEPGWDEDSVERRFPCSDFTLRRHRDWRYVEEVICRGTVIEPELTAPPFSSRDFDEGELPEDGEILRISYEQIKARIRR